MNPRRRLLTCLLFAALVLSACAQPSQSPARTPSLSVATQTPTPTPTPTALPTLGVAPASLRGVNIRVWHAFAGESAKIFTDQVALFNSVNEWGLTVFAEGYGDYLTLSEAMQAAIETGQMPHLIAALPEQALRWDGAGLVVDLAPYLSDSVYGLESSSMDDFPPVFWTQDGAGARVAAPAQRSARFLFYNQTWAHELGFEAPPETPEEFRRQACAANAAFKADSDPQNDGYGGWVVDTHWQTAASWLLAFGGGVTDGNAYRFRTDANQVALEFLKGLYDSNCAWLSTGDAPYEAFAGRRALFVTGDLAEVSAVALAMTNAASADEWTLLPFPGQESPVTVTYGPSYSILQSSPEEQLAAWLFIRWVLAPETQALWAEATGLLPLRAAVLDLVGPYRLASPQWEAAVASLRWAQRPPQLASWGKARYLLEDGLNFIFLANLPPDQIPSVLDEMQSVAEEIPEGR